MRLVPFFALSCTLSLGFGCAKKTVSTTSVITGSAALASFPTRPSAVEAIDEAGHTTRVDVAADGRFTLTLSKGHKYRIAIVTGPTGTPLIFPRPGGSLDLSFKVQSGGAHVNLGAVRFLPVAPSTGFKILTTPAATCSGGDGECAQEGNNVSCDEGEGGGGDGECVDGKDLETGKACTDGDTASDEADPTKPLAVADHNAPQEISGCDDGEEND